MSWNVILKKSYSLNVPTTDILSSKTTKALLLKMLS